MAKKKVGLWLIGACGGVGTTAALGLAAIRNKLSDTTSLVTEQARAAAEQTAAQVPALQSSLAQSRHSLAVLTGQAPAALDARLAATAPVPTAPNRVCTWQRWPTSPS